MSAAMQNLESQPKILFSDLDRTFLTHAYTVHPRTALAVKHARLAGLEIVFVTARAPESLRQVVAPVGWNGRAVCFNGAWVGDFENGEVSSSERMPVGIAAEVMEHARVLGAEPIWYGDEEILVHAETPTIAWQLGKVGEQATVVRDFSTQRAGPFKVLCIDGRDPGCFDALRARWSGSVHVVQSHQMLLEVGPRSASKGAAVRRLMAALDLTPAECAAVGDAENDLSMLEAVGYPATVGNAIEAVKQRAMYVGASCDEGGFADVVNWLIGSSQNERQTAEYGQSFPSFKPQ